MTIPRILTVAAAATALFTTAASAATVYFNDFDSPAAVGLGATATFTPAGGGLTPTIAPYAATFGNIFENQTAGLTEITLNNLPSHTGVDLDFVMAFLNSWDSRNGTCCAPDNLDLFIDGSLVAQYTYDNASGSIKDIGGGALIAQYVQFDGNQYFSDTVADMSGDPTLAFAHSGSTLKIGWQASGAGFQYGTDESWGIDNVRISLRGVGSVPDVTGGSVLALGAIALAAMGARRR